MRQEPWQDAAVRDGKLWLRRQARTGTQRNADVHFFELASFTYLHGFAFSMPADSARLGRPLTSFALISPTSI